jgi:hypothetical protein
MNTPSNLAHMAMMMCRRAGLNGAAVQDVADGMLARARQLPRSQRFGCMIRSLRLALAKELGVSPQRLPGDWVALQAAGQYEAGRREYASMRGRRWLPAFDRHSRRFAIENGVCPRCAARGRFTESGGRCKCGFQYD